MNELLGLMLSLIAVFIALRWYEYTRRRDAETDARRPWIELHKSMVDVRAKRAMVQVSQPGAHAASGPSSFVELQKDYALAVAQLQGQLDRLNDNPLQVEISEFLKVSNKPTAYWQTPEYETTFDSLCQKVAMKSRPNG
jgi:hypothetical protein